MYGGCGTLATRAQEYGRAPPRPGPTRGARTGALFRAFRFLNLALRPYVNEMRSPSVISPKGVKKEVRKELSSRHKGEPLQL